MAFASGPVSFRRFFISGPFTTKLDEAFLDAIRENAFGKQELAAPDGTETGWITPEHLFDTRFTRQKIQYDRFAYLQMRFDRTAAPASVIRAYTRIEEAALKPAPKNPNPTFQDAAEESESETPERLSKNDRVQARERALARAKEEADKGMFRRMSSIPVLFDLPSRTVYLANLGAGAGDKFIALFRDTFDASLEPAHSNAVAHRIMEAAGDPRSVEDAEPFHLVPDQRVADDNGFDVNDRTYFGREFLTWLWYQTDRENATFDIANKRTAVMFTQFMQLDCDFKVTGSDTIRCEGPATAPEARAALPLGKQPTKAGLLLSTGAAEYPLILDGPRFNVSALKLPDSEEADPRARFEERFHQITETAGLLDMLFGLFLGRRAAPNWPETIASIKSWATGATDPATLTVRFPTELAAN